MGQFDEQHKVALISCLETVLMRRSNTKYNLVVAKLNSHYDCKIRDCYEHPEYLRTILKDVYTEDYNSIIDEIKLLLDDLVNEEKITNFFKIMEGRKTSIIHH
ncbi:MAG TPA: hypothetical protein VGR54_07105 [Nitrosopumilaceae archaeon]|nr:hypothetical protein [Nitrosopumilaceae archaeon]